MKRGSVFIAIFIIVIIFLIVEAVNAEGLDWKIPCKYSEEAEYAAKAVYGEARGCPVEEQEKVLWCIVNRADDPRFPNDIISVITQRKQFTGYKESNPVLQEHYLLALKVFNEWDAEKLGIEEARGRKSSRNLDKEYVYFSGDGKKNTFRIEY